jgi:sulfur dioxygenase
MLLEQVNESDCKTYLITNEKDNRAILIDPVLNINADYLNLLQERKLRLTHVIDTHTHADHISAGPFLKEATGCEYVMYKEAPAQCVTIRVNAVENFKINDLKFQILHTPGHTRDSMTLVTEDWMFTGDVLFLDDGGGGRDDLPGGSPAEHWESLEILKKLPDYLMVYPAHDYGERQPSPLGKQKTSNPHLRDRSQEEFVEYIESLRLEPADWMMKVLEVNYACTKDPQAAWIPEDNKACEIKGREQQEAETIPVQFMEAEELKNEMLAQNKKLVLLDVREQKELSGSLGHMEGIIHIPIGSLAERISELEKYKEDEIVIICRSGVRSAVGARILLQAGYKNVLVLKGGMLAWRRRSDG